MHNLGQNLKIYTLGKLEIQMEICSFQEFSNIKWDFGPEELTRYNGFASYPIQGAAALGVSSGVAMEEMDKIANNYSSGTMHEWSGVSYQEDYLLGNLACYILSLF
jgi:multidrug efflux pump